MLEITNKLIPIGFDGVTETVKLTATGGKSPYTWEATNLPAGLSLDASTGVISGKPTHVTVATVSVTVTDSTGAAAHKNLSFGTI
jgi:hypothetical protein